MILNKYEYNILNIVNHNINDKNMCLLSPDEIIALSDKKLKITKQILVDNLMSLARKDYLELMCLDRKEEKVYYITLHFKGKNFKEEQKLGLKTIWFKMFLAISGSILSFIIGRILYKLFN